MEPWHMTKLPVLAQLGSPAPPVKVHVPTTTPLLRIPVVVGVPFEVPVRFPVRVRVLPDGIVDTTVKSSVPVTWPAEPVFRVAVPLSVEPLVPLEKHFPALKKLKPVIVRGPLVFTENEVTKFSRLDWSVPPVSCASQLPVVEVLVVAGAIVLLPQPQTASSSANTIRHASFFMNRP